MLRELRKTPGPWSGDGLGEASWDFPQEVRATERAAQRWMERRKEGNADFMAGQRRGTGRSTGACGTKEAARMRKSVAWGENC